jgi:hypothetical protein
MMSGHAVDQGHSMAGASEVAEVVAQLLRSHDAVPEEAATDLRRLLSHDLARRNTARVRLGHLRLLIEMVAHLEDADPWVSQADYTRERARRSELGQAYPDESTLRDTYGKWVCAVRAAARFARRGGEGRVPGSYRHCRPVRPPYTMHGISDALLRCYADLGEWPTEWEYEEWASIKRLLSATDPRLPGLKQIRKCFGDYHEALSTTRGAHGANRPQP